MLRAGGAGGDPLAPAAPADIASRILANLQAAATRSLALAGAAGARGGGGAGAGLGAAWLGHWAQHASLRLTDCGPLAGAHLLLQRLG
jgi:hypothetical protein